jgi:hypothetical protein
MTIIDSNFRNSNINTLNANNANINTLSSKSFIITSSAGITSNSDITLKSLSGNINLDANIVNIPSPVVLKNNFLTISTNSELDSYSTGEFQLTFSGNCINSSTIFIAYTRFGNVVTLQFPELIFSKNNGGASEIKSTQGIPADLRPVPMVIPYYVQLSSLIDQPSTDLSYAQVQLDNTAASQAFIRFIKNQNSNFDQATNGNFVIISACSLTYIIVPTI